MISIIGGAVPLTAYPGPSMVQVMCCLQNKGVISAGVGSFLPGWSKICPYCTNTWLFGRFFLVLLFSVLLEVNFELFLFPLHFPAASCFQVRILQQEWGVLLFQEAGFLVGIFPNCYPWWELQRERNFVVYASLSSFSLPWSSVCIFGHGSHLLPDEICCKMY